MAAIKPHPNPNNIRTKEGKNEIPGFPDSIPILEWQASMDVKIGLITRECAIQSVNYLYYLFKLLNYLGMDEKNHISADILTPFLLQFNK